MNLDAIKGVINGARRFAHTCTTEFGPAVGVETVDGRWIVWGIVPIDDESDVRFANFLLSEAKKIDMGEMRPEDIKCSPYEYSVNRACTTRLARFPEGDIYGLMFPPDPDQPVNRVVRFGGNLSAYSYTYKFSNLGGSKDGHE